MLTELIVRTYKTLAEVALWVMIVIGGILGLALGGAIDRPLLGLAVGTVGTFFFLAIVLGAALLLADIHSRLVMIEQRLTSTRGVPSGNSIQDPALASPSARPRDQLPEVEQAKTIPMSPEECTAKLIGLGCRVSHGISGSWEITAPNGVTSYARSPEALFDLMTQYMKVHNVSG